MSKSAFERSSRSQRVGHRALRRRPAVGAFAAFLAVLIVIVAAAVGLSVGLADPAAAEGCSSPVPAGSIRVVMVVDPGSGGSANSRCMVVPEGTTGSQLLARRAAELGAAAPRYAGSGLLCAIDGFPGSGCGDRTAGGFAYWAYFSGASGSWVYGNGNPFIKRLRDGDVEGWRFVDGAGDGQDPPPRLGPTGWFPSIVEPGPAVAPSEPSTGPTTTTTSSSAHDGAGVDAVIDGANVPVGPSDSSTSGPESTVDATMLASATSDSTSSRSSGAGAVIGIVAVIALVAAIGGGAWARSRNR